MLDFRRSHTCAELGIKDSGKVVALSGWVHRRRDHGNLIFIDLRDRFGLVQLVLDPRTQELADKLRSEWVITISGKVRERAPGMVNTKMATGAIEVEVLEMDILSKAKTPPFSVADEMIEVNEELRLKYRYLDIRRGDVAAKLEKRHKAMLAIRNYMDQEGFLEITTPILARSTPEGARDYLVPSRIYPGSFYALPQSPQLFKQILMIGGMDRYFQIATCFRDEDLRSDRQPEFTQIDLEMSFATQEEVFKVVEGLILLLFPQVKAPFRRMTHAECLERYGTDKPDLRFEMPFVRLNGIAKKTSAPFLQEAECVKAFCIKGGGDISRKNLDDYTLFASKFGLKGLYFVKCSEEGLSTGVAKFFDASLQQELFAICPMEVGDLLVIAADFEAQVNQALDHLRRRAAKERGLIDQNRFDFLWVTDFPLFKWDIEKDSLDAEHHPFTSPAFEDISLLDTEPLKARSSSYDLVLNGYEIASGSQRIHDGALQEKIFALLKLSPEAIQERFGFFIEALKYGTPPHVGIALGFDRIMMVLTKTENIRDVVAFPKTQKATDLMTEAPSTVLKTQLDDLKLRIYE